MGFWTALSALAPIAPAQAEAQEIRRQRGIQDTEASQNAQLNRERIAQEQQKTKAGLQDVILDPKPTWDPVQNSYTVLAQNSTKGLFRKPITGGESPEAEQKRKVDSEKAVFKQTTGREPSEQENIDLAYSALGLKPPPNRNMTEYQAATVALRQAQESLKEAQFKAAQDPTSLINRLKLKQAENAARSGEARLITAEAGAFGTYNNVPLRGAPIDAEGKPVGFHFQSNVRPTSTEIGRADLAGSANEQMDDIGNILVSHPELFGPTAGRITNFTQWLGSQDPVAQQLHSAAVTAAGHLAGVFGGTSDAKLRDITEVIGKNQNNPEAALAGLQQMQKASKFIQKRGTRNTVGGVSQDTPQFTEGQTATGPGGAKIVFHGGKWVPAPKAVQ